MGLTGIVSGLAGLYCATHVGTTLVRGNNRRLKYETDSASPYHDVHSKVKKILLASRRTIKQKETFIYSGFITAAEIGAYFVLTASQ